MLLAHYKSRDILRRIDPSSFSWKCQHASVNMTNSKRDYSLEYSRMICNRATNNEANKVCCVSLYQTGIDWRAYITTDGWEAGWGVLFSPVVFCFLCYQVSNEPGTRYNVPLMNALVLYVGTQAITYIHSKSGTPSMSTITHSSHMDIFQNLAVDLDTEGTDTDKQNLGWGDFSLCH